MVISIPRGLICGKWDDKTGLVVLAKHPKLLSVDYDRLALMFYSCAQVEPGKVFKIFPSREVDIRAAVAYERIDRYEGEEQYCVAVLLSQEEEGTAYQEVLMSILNRVASVDGDQETRTLRYRRILNEAYRRMQRRGGSRERSLCPYMYERPVDGGKVVAYCREVKKPCYLTIYQMSGYLQCPRYIRRQRRIQLRNARRIVRAGIQRILADADRRRSGRSVWSTPVHAILDRLFGVLPVSQETIKLAHRLADQVGERGLFQGHPRHIVAASIAYVSAKTTGESISENDIIELVGCSRTSLRRNCRELLEIVTPHARRTAKTKGRRRRQITK